MLRDERRRRGKLTGVGSGSLSVVPEMKRSMTGRVCLKQELEDRTELVGTLITMQISTLGVYARGTNEENIFKCSAG